MATKFDQIEVAKKLGITVSSVLRDVEAGKLSGHQIGSSYLFTIRDLERYLGARRTRELFMVSDDPKASAAQTGTSIGPPMKRCKDCDRLRPADEFERDGTSADWLGTVCIGCRRKKTGRQWPPAE